MDKYDPDAVLGSEPLELPPGKSSWDYTDVEELD